MLLLKCQEAKKKQKWRFSYQTIPRILKVCASLTGCRFEFVKSHSLRATARRRRVRVNGPIILQKKNPLSHAVVASSTMALEFESTESAVGSRRCGTSFDAECDCFLGRPQNVTRGKKNFPRSSDMQ
jgi:hypothetical protein